MGIKKKTTNLIIEPSPLMQISSEVVELNQSNFEKAGLWGFICKRWQMADPDKVLAYLLGSNRGALEEFRIQGQIVHFDMDKIKNHFPGLSTTGPTLVAIKLLSKVETHQVFERQVEAKVEAGYCINKAKTQWKEWLSFVNQRLLMAPKGAEVITSEGLAAAYRSWNGEQLNWVKILYNQIRLEIAGKTTRNRLFFYSSTYLSEFCPVLTEPGHIRDPLEEGESSKNKRRRFIASTPEEDEADAEPGILEPSQGLPPGATWKPVMGTPEPESPRDGEQVLADPLLFTDDVPLIRKKSQLSLTLKRNVKSLLVTNQPMLVDTNSKSTSTKKTNYERETEKVMKEREQLELLVTEKDDLIAQYQASMKEILKAKDELEKKMHAEKEKLICELRQVTINAEGWKKQCDEQSSSLQHCKELKKQVSELTQTLDTTMLQLTDQRSLYNLEKEKGDRLVKEIAVLMQQYTKQLCETKSDDLIAHLNPKTDASTMVNLEDNVRALAEANATLQTQLLMEQSFKKKLQRSIWTHELNAPPSFSLFREYELQRDAFYSITNLPRGTNLTEEEFDKVWALASHYPNMHNLICEMIARADLVLATSTKLLVPIGDLGARVLLYYLTLEKQLETKRSLEQPSEVHRYIGLPEIQLKTPEDFTVWKSALEGLVLDMQDEAGFIETLAHVQAREEVSQRGELSVAQYIYARVRTCQRLYRSLEGLKKTVLDIEEYRLQVLLPLPPVEFKTPSWMKMSTLVAGSYLKQRYLGKYDQMFDENSEKPFPTWQAIEWLLEDYGLSRKHWRQWDKLYPRLSQAWSTAIPIAVTTNPHFCPLKGKRRYKWAPWARIDSIPYNWPMIPGTFGTYQECAISYKTFFEAHRSHTDPVCFRAAVFCSFLAYMCSQYKLVININRYDETKVEFQLWMKLQQHPARYIRLLECLAITNFLNGPSSVFALEFSNKRQQQISCWLNYQKTHETYLMAYDEDVKRNWDDLEMQTFAKELELEDEFKHKKPKVDVRRRH